MGEGRAWFHVLYPESTNTFSKQYVLTKQIIDMYVAMKY